MFQENQRGAEMRDGGMKRVSFVKPRQPARRTAETWRGAYQVKAIRHAKAA